MLDETMMLCCSLWLDMSVVHVFVLKTVFDELYREVPCWADPANTQS